MSRAQISGRTKGLQRIGRLLTDGHFCFVLENVVLFIPAVITVLEQSVVISKSESTPSTCRNIQELGIISSDHCRRSSQFRPESVPGPA